MGRSTFATLNAAPFASVFLIVALLFFPLTFNASGFHVDIGVPSRYRSCGEGTLFVLLRVLPDGRVRVDRKTVEVDTVPILLKEIFGDRVERLVFVSGEGNVAFGQVSAVIDATRPNVDRIALLSHTVQQHPGLCGPTIAVFR
jgi:biopolymer transport protein ExbD